MCMQPVMHIAGNMYDGLHTSLIVYQGILNTKMFLFEVDLNV